MRSPFRLVVLALSDPIVLLSINGVNRILGRRNSEGRSAGRCSHAGQLRHVAALNKRGPASVNRGVSADDRMAEIEDLYRTRFLFPASR